MNPFNNMNPLRHSTELQKFSSDIIENLIKISFVRNLIEQVSNIKFTDIDGKRYIKQGTTLKFFEMNVLEHESRIILVAYYLYSLYYDMPYASVFLKRDDFDKDPLLHYSNVGLNEVISLWRFLIQQNAPIPRDMDVSEYTQKYIRGIYHYSKLFLKRLSAYNTIWHPESTLVFKSHKERLVIGRLQNNEIVKLDNKSLELCDKWDFKPDESLLSTESENSDEEVEDISNVNEQNDDKSIWIEMALQKETLKNQLKLAHDEIEILKTQLKRMKLELGRVKLLNHKLLG